MNICIFGASITWGAYDSEAAGWANRLRMYLEPKDIDVYNLGVCGDTTTDLLKRIKVEAESRNPDLIIFGIGTNDSKFILSLNRQQTSPEDYRNNLEKLTKIAQEFTDKIIFVGLTPVDETKTDPWKKDKSYLNRCISGLNSILEDFCKRNNLMFLSMNGLISDNELYDGLHPNAQGHKKMFEKILKSIKPLLPNID